VTSDWPHRAASQLAAVNKVLELRQNQIEVLSETAFMTAAAIILISGQT
jgi:hypothetical protein